MARNPGTVDDNVTTRKPAKPATGGATVDGLNRGELVKDFGQTYGIGLILSNPELMLIAYQSQGYENAYFDKKTGKIVKGANTGVEWDANLVAAAIQQSAWFDSKDGNQRAAEAARTSDPTSWATRVANMEASIQQAATAAGADLTGVNVSEFAAQMLTDNFLNLSSSADEGVPARLLRAYLAPYIKRNATGDLSGQAGISAEELRAKAESYGVTLSDQWYMDAVRKLADGTITSVDLDNEIITHSQSRYVGLAGMISATRSVKDIADPYMQMMASTMELNPATLTLNDPDIQAALQTLDAKTGQVRTKGLYEFQQELRNKPAWGNTTQGRRELNTGAMQMLKDFGFVK
jgi:hypothetical protein